MNDYKRFAQRIGLIGFTNISIALSSIILLPILTNNLNINEYGIWIQINVTLNLMNALTTLGLPYTMVRFFPAFKSAEIKESFYSMGFVIAIVILTVGSLFFLFSKNISIILFDSNIFITKLFSLILITYCLNAFLTNYFRALQKIRKYSLFILIQTYLMVILTYYLLKIGFGLNGAIYGFLITQIVLLIIMFLFIIADIGIGIPKFNNIKDYLSFGIPTIPGNISSWIVDLSDRYMINIFLGISFVAYYSPAYTLGNIVTMLSGPLALLLPTVLSQYYEQNQIEKIKSFSKYSLKYYLILAIPTVFGLSLLSKQILLILTTPQIALNSYFITPLISVSALFFGIYIIFLNGIFLEKKTKILGLLWIISAITNILLNIILIYYIGIIGAAIATIIAYGMVCFFTIKYSTNYLNFKFDLKYLPGCIISSIIMSIIIGIFNPIGIINVITVIIICILIYTISILILKVITIDEINEIKAILFG